MVKNSDQKDKDSEKAWESENQEDYATQAASSGLAQKIENNYSHVGQGEEEDKRLLAFESTAVGCVIYFLRRHSPSPIEEIVKFVKSKEGSLVTSQKGKYKKDAFGVVDYALTWYPKLFLLNDRFHYYLNEKEAEKYEKKYKLMKMVNNGKKKLKYKEKVEKRRENINKMKKIKTQIEDDLRSGTSEPSLLTKTYQILTSDNKQAAEDLKLVIRSAYLSLKGISP